MRFCVYIIVTHLIFKCERKLSDIITRNDVEKNITIYYDTIFDIFFNFYSQHLF